MNPFWSIKEASRAIKSKKVSSVDLTIAYLDRLKSLGAKHNAVAELCAEMAMHQATMADNSVPRTVLHGIPFGVKDLLSVAGTHTRWGSPGHEDQKFDYTATSVQRLLDQGAVLLAKLEMIELAGGGNYNIAGASRGGACGSAWDNSRWAGGSSSGSGAATALGCVGFSLGSETSGSIVCPSAFNGCTGFRPTYGRVSRHGAMALAWSLDRIGPICRSAEDAGIVMQAIAGQDPNDPSTFEEKLSLSRPKPKRIGLVKHDFAANKAADCEKAYNDAIEVFKKAGFEIVDIEYPKIPYGVAIDIIVNAEGSSAHENFIRSERLEKLADVNQVAGLAAGLRTPASDYLWAMRLRNEALKANVVWEKCDAIFLPVFYHGAPPSDETLDKGFQFMGGDGGPSNLLGWPAMAFPMGFEGHLPLGGQILAPCFEEGTCYQIVSAFQKETDWHTKRPPEATAS